MLFRHKFWEKISQIIFRDILKRKIKKISKNFSYMASYWRQNIVIFDNFDKFQPIFVILTSFGWINHLKRWNKLVYVSYRSKRKQFLPLKKFFFGLITSYWRQNDVILDSFYQFEPIYVILTNFVWFDHLKKWNKLVNYSYTRRESNCYL